MDYKKNITMLFCTGILFLGYLFYGCSDNQKMTTDNTYYVEVVCTYDSLKNKVAGSITGKTSYYKNDKQRKNDELQIVSLNYVTEDHPNMHYFKNIVELGQPVKKGTRKIVLTINGNFTYDSTYYSIEKFTYNDDKWNKTSDMGFIQAIPRSVGIDKTLKYEFIDLVYLVTKNTIASTY